MGLIRTTAPADEPVFLDDAKMHLRVESDDEDLLIAGLITAAREQAEARMHRTVASCDWTLTTDRFTDPMELLRPRVTAIVSVKYLDTAGVQQTMGVNSYTLDGASDFEAYLRPAYGTSWPSTRSQAGAVQVRYTAGWAPADVPQSIRQWMLMAISTWYGQREGMVTGREASIAELPSTFFAGLLSPYTIPLA